MRLLTLIPELLNKGIPQIENMIDSLPRHATKKYPERPVEQVDTLVFHHMASEAPLINQAKFHVNNRGWAGLGYHIVIWGNRIIQANPLDVQSNHTAGYNPRAIGVAVLADFSKRAITARERELVAAVLASLNASLPGRQLKGHNECGVKTSCPVVSMEMIRSDVIALENEISYLQSSQKREEMAFRIANHTMYLYHMAKGKMPDGSEATAGKKQWAQEQLLKLQPDMLRYGMLK